MRIAHETARESLKASQVRQKQLYDRNSNIKAYTVGDVVNLIDSATKVGPMQQTEAIYGKAHSSSQVNYARTCTESGKV